MTFLPLSCLDLSVNAAVVVVIFRCCVKTGTLDLQAWSVFAPTQSSDTRPGARTATAG